MSCNGRYEEFAGFRDISERGKVTNHAGHYVNQDAWLFENGYLETFLIEINF